MKIRHLLSLLAVMSLATCSTLAQSGNNTATNTNITIEGTVLSSTRNAVEVLQLLPGITVNSDDEIAIDGRMGVAVFIGTHKITDISELYSLLSSRIADITIQYSPGAEYGKDVQAVIIFTIRKDMADGISLDNDLTVSISNHPTLRDELNINYRNKGLNLGGLVSWFENRNDVHEREFVYTYYNANLEKAAITERDNDTRERQIIGQANMSYDISNRHGFYVFYRIETTPYKKGYELGTSSLYASNDDLNNNKPAIVSPIDKWNENKQTRQQLNVEYHGMWGNWSMDIGHNSQWFNHENPDMPNAKLTPIYKRKSYKMRSYIHASFPLWNGGLSLGVENNMQDMDVLHLQTSGRLHTLNSISTWSEYISLSQKWGNVSATVGLRHEYNRHRYRPFEDDDLLDAINYMKNDPDLFKEFKEANPGWENTRAGSLINDGCIVDHRNYLYPNLAIDYTISDKSAISLDFANSYHIADPELSRIYLSDVKFTDSSAGEQRLLQTELIYNTTLSWRYDWLNLTASHHYYHNPLCVTNSDKNVYNGNSYHALDLAVSLSPKIGCWQPSLLLMLSKQWFNIELANGRTSMKRPRSTIHFSNVITLPHDWTIRANAEWYSKGDKRNVYYYKSDFLMNLSVQKELCNKHLSLALKVNNMFHTSWKDITTYNVKASGVSNGIKSRKLTVVSISAKYTL